MRAGLGAFAAIGGFGGGGGGAQADCFELVRMPRPASSAEVSGGKVMDEIRLARASVPDFDSGALLKL